ncbi:hypothetical protein ACHAWF_014883, partial [Thalassiosira exigua]
GGALLDETLAEDEVHVAASSFDENDVSRRGRWEQADEGDARDDWDRDWDKRYERLLSMLETADELEGKRTRSGPRARPVGGRRQGAIRRDRRSATRHVGPLDTGDDEEDDEAWEYPHRRRYATIQSWEARRRDLRQVSASAYRPLPPEASDFVAGSAYDRHISNEDAYGWRKSQFRGRMPRSALGRTASRQPPPPERFNINEDAYGRKRSQFRRHESGAARGRTPSRETSWRSSREQRWRQQGPRLKREDDSDPCPNGLAYSPWRERRAEAPGAPRPGWQPPLHVPPPPILPPIASVPLSRLVSSQRPEARSQGEESESLDLSRFRDASQSEFRETYRPQGQLSGQMPRQVVQELHRDRVTSATQGVRKATGGGISAPTQTTPPDDVHIFQPQDSSVPEDIHPGHSNGADRNLGP